MAPAFVVVLCFDTARARCWGSHSIIICEPIRSPVPLRPDLRGARQYLAGIRIKASNYGARQTRHLLLQKGFVLSMSRVGTLTDKGYAERFVGALKLAGADRRPYHTLGEFLQAAEA